MKVAVIGHGAIASHVRIAMVAHDIEEIAQIVRPGKERSDLVPRISAIDQLPQVPDLIIDCGGHAALIAHGPLALGQGIDVLTLSLGALADAALSDALHCAAIAGGTRLHLVSGAIGALDALRAACTGPMASVTYTGRKPPLGWLGSPAEAQLDLHALDAVATHFSGSARKAALDYPKNANVAAAVALAGIGFDKTEVALVADPAITTNIHEISAKGDFGDFHFKISGNSLPDNPRSSALAAMSIVAALAEQSKPIGF